jgi:signal transduction histidine kinase
MLPATATAMAKMPLEPFCFLSIPYSKKFDILRQSVDEVLSKIGVNSISSESSAGFTRQELISRNIAKADFIIADVTGNDPNVFFEIGLARAKEKKIIFLVKSDYHYKVPSDLQGYVFLTYKTTPNGLNELQKQLTQLIRRVLSLPTNSLESQSSFFVDWSKLESRDIENLVNELLIQMGFLNVEWIKAKSPIELIAELPKRDPDGFDYKDLWLISFGHRYPVEMILKDLRYDLDYLTHRLFRNKGILGRENLFRSGQASVTLLFVLIGEPLQKTLFDFDEINEINYRNRSMNVRFRIWDESYLTSLVYKYSHLGIKYFSDESRSLSKYRKTPEELNRENIRLLEAERKLRKELEELNNKLVRLERDAIWKDISFSAAHKMGNPIFAIETNLEPLLRRINSQRTDEAAQIVSNIKNSVEKAKGIVEQFKSLAKAQNINPVPTHLYPFFEDVCREVTNCGIDCEINCPKDLQVEVDPERLSECFDELGLNATHCFRPHQRKRMIQIVVDECMDNLPFLDSSKKYILIHFKDNGVGVPIENKDKIFDAFFTTRDQGTGLGLALVRRIIEGHGGAIREVGFPKKGADFEIYLPLSDKRIQLKQSKGGIQNGENINS